MIITISRDIRGPARPALMDKKCRKMILVLADKVASGSHSPFSGAGKGGNGTGCFRYGVLIFWRACFIIQRFIYGQDQNKAGF